MLLRHSTTSVDGGLLCPTGYSLTVGVVAALFRQGAFGDGLVSDDVRADAFTSFVESTERRLRHALTAAVGPELGREATADALAYGWEHWDRVGGLENPAGYLYRVGRNLARRMNRTSAIFERVDQGGEAWVEPGLPSALGKLPEKQRVVVSLVHGYGWSFSEAADFLGVSKGTVQSYVDRGLKRLRRELGVEL